jgi:hypothetical protein
VLRRGRGPPVFKDTRRLSPAARALYAGVKVTKDGLEVLMHDKVGALTKVGQHLGMFVERRINTDVSLEDFLAQLDDRRRPALENLARLRADFTATRRLPEDPDQVRQDRALELNKAQLYIHERLEAQRQGETGKVRALILKGRQQGASTYIGGALLSPGVAEPRDQGLHPDPRAEGDRQPLRDGRALPRALAAQAVDRRANAKELKSSTSWTAATRSPRPGPRRSAGRHHPAVPRLRGGLLAERAAHFAGVVQAVPDLPGTEIILESTANGVGGEFHAGASRRWRGSATIS